MLKALCCHNQKVKFKIFHMFFFFSFLDRISFSLLHILLFHPNQLSHSFLLPLSCKQYRKQDDYTFLHAHLTYRYNYIYELTFIYKYRGYFCFTMIRLYVYIEVFNSIISFQTGLIKPFWFLSTMHLDPTSVPAMVVFSLIFFPIMI